MTAALPLARREVVRFLRQRSRVVGALFPPLVAWALVGSGFATSLRAPGASGASPSESFAFFFPGTVVLVILFASIFATISTIEDRREGFLQAVLVSPVRPLQIVLGKVLGATVLGLSQGALLLLFVPLLPFSVDARSLLLALLVLAMVSVALAGLGFAIAWSLESVQGFHAIMNLFLIPMWLLSGSFFPVEGAAPWLRAAMALDPLTYGVAALRHGLDPGSAAFPSLALSLGATALFAAATLAASVAIVKRSPSGPARLERAAR